MATTTGTPASVRWGLMLMGALLLSQVIGLRWVGPAGQAAGLHAAPLAASPASVSIAPACGAVLRPAPPRRSC